MNSEKIDNFLKAVLFRRDCPDTQVLGDYILFGLPKTQKNESQSHIKKCPYCSKEIARLFMLINKEKSVQLTKNDHLNSFGCVWKFIDKASKLALQVKTNLESNLMLSLPIGVKSSFDQKQDDIIHTFFLPGEYAKGVEVEGIISTESNNPELCQIGIKVQILKKWPELSGVMVKASVNHWSKIALTQSNGEVKFHGINRELLSELQIIIYLNTEELYDEHKI